METDVDRIGERMERPWGAWTLLEMGSGYKVKRLEVRPGKRLSLQKHFCRSEHWVVVQGTARVTNDDRVFLLKMNESTFIPLGVSIAWRIPIPRLFWLSRCRVAPIFARPTSSVWRTISAAWGSMQRWGESEESRARRFRISDCEF